MVKKNTGFVAQLRLRLWTTARKHPTAVKYSLIAAAAVCAIVFAATGYYYVTFSRMIDARLHGERDRVVPRVFARPLEIRKGEGLSEKELLDRLNDLGYAQRTLVQSPGEFAVIGGLVTLSPRAGSEVGKIVTVSFQRPQPQRRG